MSPAGMMEDDMPNDRAYTPSEIADLIGAPHTAGSLAQTIEAFWPTIRDALKAYDHLPVVPHQIELD
jgi:hypothetical protein